jgi:hypothetical protein
MMIELIIKMEEKVILKSVKNFDFLPSSKESLVPKNVNNCTKHQNDATRWHSGSS